MQESIINIKSLNLKINDLQLSSNFSFSLLNGERLGITGPSGCGKSTLLKVIINPSLFNKSSFEELVIKDKSNLSYMPQSSGLLPWFSLKKNLSIFNKTGNCIDNIVSFFKLHNALNSFPNQLSGGEYQRAILLTAIINQPDIYLADEPLTELDINNKWNLLNFWSEKIREEKTSLILVSHDIETLLYMCDRVIILADKPFSVKQTLSLIAEHPRSKEYLISDEFINIKSQLLASMGMDIHA